MKVTLKDIADDTGYSVSTVSRVLNGSDKISSETRDEILESAERHDYKIPKIRNPQSSKRTLNIALVATGFHEGEFYVSFYHGLNRAAKKQNIRLFLIGVLDMEEDVPSIIKSITLSHYDGAILYIPEFGRADYTKLSNMIPSKFPIVSNAMIENPVFSTITFDSYSGGHLAALHLEERGHINVGIIKGPSERAESRFRYNGFSDYIDHHENMELTWAYDGKFTFETGYAAFEEFDKLAEKPTAIFACNDDMCNGFMEAGLERGYEFPDDVAMIGYDDLPVCRHNRPTMSSIKTDYEQLGSATMKLLREKLSEPDLKTNMLSFVPIAISKRESS